MAHNPVVGTGLSIPLTATSSATTSFVVESQYVRLTPVAGITSVSRASHGAHIVVSQTTSSPSAAATDYYIPANTSETLSMQRYSCKIVGITTAASTSAATTAFTQLTCPEGQQVPFSIGNYVTLKNCNVAGFNTSIVHSRVISVDTNAGVDGSFQTKLTVDANCNLIVGFDEDSDVPGGKGFNDTTLYSSARIAARTDEGAGGLHIIQVQTTGEA